MSNLVAQNLEIYRLACVKAKWIELPNWDALLNLQQSLFYYPLVATCVYCSRDFVVTKQPVKKHQQATTEDISPDSPLSRQLQREMAFQTEGFVKMILELQQQCAGRGSELSKTLVALMVSNWN